MRLAIVAVAGILAVVVIVGLTTNASAIVARDRDVREQVPGAVTRVVIEGDEGNVHITGRPGATVVRRHERYLIRDPAVSQTVTDGTLRIDTRCGTRILLPRCAVDLDLAVPPGASVVVHRKKGDIRVDGMRGPVRATSDKGHVQVR
jgi:hypothetical protein